MRRPRYWPTPDLDAVLEHRVDEPVGTLIDLPLRQWRQLDRLRPARQQIGDVAQATQARRACEQEPPGPRIGVDLVLDGEEQVRHSLDLVDDQQPVVAYEQAGIRLSCVPVVDLPSASWLICRGVYG